MCRHYHCHGSRSFVSIIPGLEAVKQALAARHTGTALVRSPAKMPLSHDNLQVVEADIFSVDSLKEHLSGQDAVLSCLGFPPQKPKVT